MDPLPFSDETNTGEATVGEDDPICNGEPGFQEGNTVWYQYTPGFDGFVEANTFGSTYDTTLSAYVEVEGALEQIACNDDAVESVQSRINIPVAAGETVFFIVGSFPEEPGGPENSGGDLTFSLDVGGPPPPPLEVEIEVDSVGIIHPVSLTRNEVDLTGTAVCSRLASLDVFAEVRQLADGRFVIHGHGTEFFHQCEGEISWTFHVQSENGLFARGLADVDIDAHAFDPESGDHVFVEVLQEIRLLGPGGTADTVGLVDPAQGMWHLRNSVGSVTSFFYGNPGDLPISGDWDGDGIATPGLYRQTDGFFYARNSNTQGTADAECFAGNPADIPIAGDWDGDGDDNLGIYRPSQQVFYLFTSTCTGSPMGAAQISFLFGNPGDKPVVGDWDGDGMDEVGLHRESTGLLYWRNTLDTGIADGTIFFGNPGDRFVAGDWGIVDGVDTPAVFRPPNTTFFFRHTLTQGNADSQFVFGQPGWLPVAGEFGLG